MAWMSIFAVVGAGTIAFVIIDSFWSLLELISSYMTPYFLPNEEQSLVKKFGPWAAVTGSTDGIGREYALELARRGLNIVLISRSEEKLRKVAKEIEKLHAVKTKIIVADFSGGAEVYAHIDEELKDIPLGILVNNVGSQYDFPMRVSEVENAVLWRVIHVNVCAATLLCRAVLPGMRARRKGVIVNVSSGSEFQPLPLMAVYAATKSYISSFTEALREECSRDGIHVQHLCPFFVSTKMNSFSEELMAGGLLVPDARTYAAHAVATLGRVSRTTGYWIHGIQCTFVKLPPVWIRTKIGAVMNKRFRKEYEVTNKLKNN